MRQVLMAMLAVGATVASSMPSLAAQQQYEQPFCYSILPCVPTTERQYDACTSLAVERGWNLAASRHRELNWFIYQCLTGKIPR
jgi:hypothetical protein